MRCEAKWKRGEIGEGEARRGQRSGTKPTKSTKTKRNTMLDYFPHMSRCLSPGEDRI